VDAVIDLAGGELQTRSFAVLHKGDALISTVSAPDRAAAAAEWELRLYVAVQML